MRSFLLGCFFLCSGIALLGWPLWKLSGAGSGAAPAACPRPEVVVSGAPVVAAPAGAAENPVTASAMPADPANAGPADMNGKPEPPADASAPSDEPAMAESPAKPTADAQNADVAPAGPVVLLFDVRSVAISPALAKELENLAKAGPQARFRMEVAAGEMKNNTENEKLAKKRARAIRKILEDAGIPERRVSYRLVLPGPQDGDPPKTSDDWRKATVRVLPAK